MSHARHEPPTGPAAGAALDVHAVFARLPDLDHVTPWDDAFASAAPPPPPPSPPPVVDAAPPVVEPLVEVEPLVPAPEPVQPDVPAEPAAPRLYVASSWDSLGAPAAPVLEGRQASQVLSELGFLDD